MYTFKIVCGKMYFEHALYISIITPGLCILIIFRGEFIILYNSVIYLLLLFYLFYSLIAWLLVWSGRPLIDRFGLVVDQFPSRRRGRQRYSVLTQFIFITYYTP